MMWSDYYESGFNQVKSSEHECFLEGLKVVCNSLFCNYTEEFTSIEDAVIAMEVHSGQG